MPLSSDGLPQWSRAIAHWCCTQCALAPITVYLRGQPQGSSCRYAFGDQSAAGHARPARAAYTMRRGARLARHRCGVRAAGSPCGCWWEKYTRAWGRRPTWGVPTCPGGRAHQKSCGRLYVQVIGDGLQQPTLLRASGTSPDMPRGVTAEWTRYPVSSKPYDDIRTPCARSASRSVPPYGHRATTV
jgi:hypothetical protein